MTELPDLSAVELFADLPDEEREHLDLLVREYRLLRQRQGRRGGKSAGKPAQ